MKNQTYAIAERKEYTICTLKHQTLSLFLLFRKIYNIASREKVLISCSLIEKHCKIAIVSHSLVVWSIYISECNTNNE